MQGSAPLRIPVQQSIPTQTTVVSFESIGREKLPAHFIRSKGNNDHPRQRIVPRQRIIIVAVITNLLAAACVIYLATKVGGSEAREEAINAATVALPVSNEPRNASLTVPVLSLPARLQVVPGRETFFPISVDGTDGVPLRSSVVISGLPPGAALSEGRLTEDSWNLNSDEIGDLYLVLPNRSPGQADVYARLIGPDGRVVAAAETTIVVLATPEPASASFQSAAEKPTPASPLPTDNPEERLQLTGIQLERNVELKNGSPNTDKPGWTVIRSVNLREHPDSRARVIGVVSKGAMVAVYESKGGWLRVTTQDTLVGWLYSSFVRSPSGVVHVQKRRKATNSNRPANAPFWQNWGASLFNPKTRGGS